MSDAKSALIRAIALTDEILELLDAGEFERVGKLEALREPLIRQAFTESIEQIDLIKAHHLKNLNQQVVDRLTLFKQSIILQQQRLKIGTKAASEYQKNADRHNSDPIFSI